MTQEPPQRFPVHFQDFFLDSADGALHPVLFDAFPPGFQQPRAHERRERERDQPRGENRHYNGDREFAEDAPHQPRHKDERKKYRRERNRHGENRETDLARAFERRLERLHPFFHQAHRVFQKHDGVVHQKSDGQRQRHQRQIVQAVPELAHGHKRKQERQRKGHGGDERIGGPAEKYENHGDDQHKREDQRRLHVGHGIYDRLG